MALAIKHKDLTASGDTTLTQITSYHVKETSGAAAAVINVRLTNVAGTIIIPIRLAANEFADMSFSHPLVCSSGTFYMELVSGAVQAAFSGR